MIETKLILIEGPPGSGKTTTAEHLAAEIARAGKPCHCFLEWSTEHPIAIGDDLHLGQAVASSITHAGAVLQQWQQFVQARQADDQVTVMESRFWQTSVMLMYAAGQPLETILASNQAVIATLPTLQPVLIYFAIDDLAALATRTVQVKEAEWQLARQPGSWGQHIFAAFDAQPWFTARGLTGFGGMVAFLEEWATVTAVLYERVPFPKLKIANPQQDWPLARQQMRRFLGLLA